MTTAMSVLRRVLSSSPDSACVHPNVCVCCHVFVWVPPKVRSRRGVDAYDWTSGIVRSFPRFEPLSVGYRVTKCLFVFGHVEVHPGTGPTQPNSRQTGKKKKGPPYQWAATAGYVLRFCSTRRVAWSPRGGASPALGIKYLQALSEPRRAALHFFLFSLSLSILRRRVGTTKGTPFASLGGVASQSGRCASGSSVARKFNASFAGNTYTSFFYLFFFERYNTRIEGHRVCMG